MGWRRGKEREKETGREKGRGRERDGEGGGEEGEEGSGQGFKGFPYGRVANYGKELALRFVFSGVVSVRRRPCPARCHTTLDLCRGDLRSLFFCLFPFFRFVQSGRVTRFCECVRGEGRPRD